MEIDKKQRDLAKDARDAIDLIGDGIGTAASPSVLLLILLWSSMGEGRGFDGYITNMPLPSK